jgi:hypothetical protein
VDPVFILVVAVEAQFILNEKENEKAAGHSDGQPHQVDESVSLVLFNVSPGCDNVVEQHPQSPFEFESDPKQPGSPPSGAQLTPALGPVSLDTT